MAIRDTRDTGFECEECDQFVYEGCDGICTRCRVAIGLDDSDDITEADEAAYQRSLEAFDEDPDDEPTGSRDGWDSDEDFTGEVARPDEHWPWLAGGE